MTVDLAPTRILPAEKWLLTQLKVTLPEDGMPYELLKALYPDVLPLSDEIHNQLSTYHSYRDNDDVACLHLLVAYTLSQGDKDNQILKPGCSTILDIVTDYSVQGDAFIGMITSMVETQRILMTSAADVLILNAGASDLAEQTMNLWEGEFLSRYYNKLFRVIHALTTALLMKDEHWIETAYPYIEECRKQKAIAVNLVQTLKTQLVTELS